jgi:uncharacterized protein DUF4240
LRASDSRIGCYVPRVDEDTFWALIEECRQESRNDTEFTVRVLFRRLRLLEAAEVIESVRIWERARSGLYSWPVTDGAQIIVSGTRPSGHDPGGPEGLFGERVDLGDPVAVRRRFPRLAAFRRDNPELGVPELR